MPAGEDLRGHRARGEEPWWRAAPTRKPWEGEAERKGGAAARDDRGGGGARRRRRSGAA